MLKDHTIDKDFKIYSKEKSTESGIRKALKPDGKFIKKVCVLRWHSDSENCGIF